MIIMHELSWSATVLEARSPVPASPPLWAELRYRSVAEKSEHKGPPAEASDRQCPPQSLPDLELPVEVSARTIPPKVVVGGEGMFVTCPRRRGTQVDALAGMQGGRAAADRPKKKNWEGVLDGRSWWGVVASCTDRADGRMLTVPLPWSSVMTIPYKWHAVKASVEVCVKLTQPWCGTDTGTAAGTSDLGNGCCSRPGRAAVEVW